MRIEGYYTVEIRDKTGQLLRRIKRKSKSYVRALDDYLNCQMAQTTPTVTDISGNTHSAYFHATNFAMNGAAGDTNRGVVFGTGNTAVDISDNALDALIAHGTDSGKLSYGANAFSSPAVSGSSCSFTITRTGTNNSGASIAVAEIGLHMYGRDSVSYSYYLACRDVLASAFSVPANGAITVVYTIKVTA